MVGLLEDFKTLLKARSHIHIDLEKLSLVRQHYVQFHQPFHVLGVSVVDAVDHCLIDVYENNFWIVAYPRILLRLCGLGNEHWWNVQIRLHVRIKQVQIRHGVQSLVKVLTLERCSSQKLLIILLELD